MSKIFKPLINLFKFIYKIIDKFIVIPISRMIYRINEVIRANSGRIEKILNRPNVLIYISLFCAIAIFVLIDTKSISLVSDEAEILSDQVVNVIYNEEAYVIEGVPKTVDITLIGRKSYLYLAKSLGKHEVVLDLSDKTVGTYKVKLKYNHNIKSVNYKLDPSIVTVKISEKVSSIKTLDYDLLNEDKLDKKLNIKNVELDRSEVIVKGSEETLNKIATVKALVDLKAANLTEKGTFTVDSIILVAYDNDGNKLTNVEIVPGKISASVTVESYYDELPVKVVTEGTLTPGYALSSVSSSITKVGVYGDEEVIKSLSYIEAKININGLSTDKTYNVSLIKPSGVRYFSETSTKVEVKLEKETSREISGVIVEKENLGNGYNVSANSVDDQSITVIVKGVSSVIDELTASDIKAVIDLSGKTPGTYDVKVKVSVNDVRVSAVPKTETVKVRISNK